MMYSSSTHRSHVKATLLIAVSLLLVVLTVTHDDDHRLRTVHRPRRAETVEDESGERLSLDAFDKDVKEKEGAHRIKLAWQLAYPFSGSTVALRVIQDYTDYSMATNYGEIVDTNRGFEGFKWDSIPVNEDTPNGPYKYRIDKDLPPKGSFVLAKTLCAGHCIDYGTSACDAREIAIPLTDLENFFVSCATGRSYAIKGKKVSLVQYNPWQAHKIMLLVRDPIAIVRARYVDWAAAQYPVVINEHRLTEWCKERDDEVSAHKLLDLGYYSEKGRALVEGKGVVCHTEIFKITHWYNQALKLTEFMHEDSKNIYNVYFEDYDIDLGAQLEGMLSFLGYTINEGQRSSSFRKTGDDVPLISDEDIAKMRKLVEYEATDATKELFSRYLV